MKKTIEDNTFDVIIILEKICDNYTNFFLRGGCIMKETFVFAVKIIVKRER